MPTAAVLGQDLGRAFERLVCQRVVQMMPIKPHTGTCPRPWLCVQLEALTFAAVLFLGALVQDDKPQEVRPSSVIGIDSSDEVFTGTFRPTFSMHLDY